MNLKIILIALVALALVGCSNLFAPIVAVDEGLLNESYPYIELPLEEVWPKVAALHYYPDGPSGYWQSPKETLAREGGDCEDIATVLVYYLGKEASRVSIIKPNGNYHSIISYRDRYLEPQVYGRYLDPKGFKVRRVYPYEVVMRASTANGSKNVLDN